MNDRFGAKKRTLTIWVEKIMKKLDTGQTLSILANVGVIVGIAFLAIEIQQNTRSLEVNAYRELINQTTFLATSIMDNPELALLGSTATSFEGLTRQERSQIGAHFYLVVRSGDLAYYQYEQGMLSDERLESAMGPVNDRRCRQIFKEWWAGTRSNFVTAYREYIDSKIAEC